MVDSLDEEDRKGALALIVRTVRIQEERKRLSEIKRQVDERLKKLNDQWDKARAGFAAFGFDLESEGLWKEVMNGVGAVAYNSAVDHAKNIPLQPLVFSPKATESDTTGKEEDKGAASGLEDQHSQDDENAGSTVREILLKELENAGNSGKKASDLRVVVERQLSREVHDKTVGMTLYRLSGDGLVRREGRTWFIVPAKSETMNPGVGAPGSD